MGYRDISQFVGARTPVQTFFLGKPDSIDLPIAAKIGAPLVPLGIGGMALAYFLKKPGLYPLGALASLLGVSLLALRGYYADKELAQRGIVSIPPSG